MEKQYIRETLSRGEAKKLQPFLAEIKVLRANPAFVVDGSLDVSHQTSFPQLVLTC